MKWYKCASGDGYWRDGWSLYREKWEENKWQSERTDIQNMPLVPAKCISLFYFFLKN